MCVLIYFFLLEKLYNVVRLAQASIFILLAQLRKVNVGYLSVVKLVRTDEIHNSCLSISGSVLFVDKRLVI